MSDRNVELTKLAGRLRRDGAGAAEIESALLAAPERAGLPASECRSIARSIAKKPAPPPRPTSDALAQLDPLEELAQRRGWHVDALRMLGAEGHDRLEFNGRTQKRVVSFLMRDASGAVVSRRIRRASGARFGSRDDSPKALSEQGRPLGLFVAPWPLPSSVPLLIVEGEADAAAALSAGAPACIATPGSSPGARVLGWLQALVAGRSVILAPDPDKAGRDWLELIGATCANAGCAVRFIPAVPGLDLDRRLANAR